jgi:hypothetical protein
MQLHAVFALEIGHGNLALCHYRDRGKLYWVVILIGYFTLQGKGLGKKTLGVRKQYTQYHYYYEFLFHTQ